MNSAPLPAGPVRALRTVEPVTPSPRSDTQLRHGPPPRSPDPAVGAHGLNERHLRVLGYLGLYLDRRGHLPTHTELAEACRLRSSSTAHRLVRDLERLGLLRREAPQSRLATLAPCIATRPEVDDADLWVLLRTLELQSACEFKWANDGLSLTSDLSIVDWVLQRAQQHLARLRAYEHVRVLLAAPDDLTIERMQQLETIMTRAARAYDPLKHELRTWFTYSAMGNAATARINRNISSSPALRALHLAVDTEEDMSSRTDWRYCNRALHAGDGTVEAAAKEIIDISDEATARVRTFLSTETADVIPLRAVSLGDLTGPGPVVH